MCGAIRKNVLWKRKQLCNPSCGAHLPPAHPSSHQPTRRRPIIEASATLDTLHKGLIPFYRGNYTINSCDSLEQWLGDGCAHPSAESRLLGVFYSQ